jgi:hypothetical protein
MRKHLSRVANFLTMLLLAGCGSTPTHTNTLIFGTNTKLALDVGADPTGISSITLGYKRQEAVWMPLLANKGKDDQREPATDCVSEGCLFQGTSPTGEDAYSVLATFGATFSGEGQASSGVKAAGGIAQYFATGLAARELARSGGAQLVSIQPEGSIQQQAAVFLQREAANIEKILGYVNIDGNVDEKRLTAVTSGTGLDASWVKWFAGGPASKLRDELTKGPSRALVASLARNIQEK